MQGIRLDQGALQLKGAQKLFERSPLAGFVGVVGLLSQGDTERPGIDRDLGDKAVGPQGQLEVCPSCTGSTLSAAVWFAGKAPLRWQLTSKPQLYKAN